MQLAGRLEPVEPGHPDVHQHDVGPQPRRGLEALAAVGGLADDLDVVAAAEHQRQRRPDERVVVDHEHPDARARHAAHGIQPRSTHVAPVAPVVEPAAVQLGPLGQPDQPEPGAGVGAGPKPIGLRSTTSMPVVRGAG